MPMRICSISRMCRARAAAPTATRQSHSDATHLIYPLHQRAVPHTRAATANTRRATRRLHLTPRLTRPSATQRSDCERAEVRSVECTEPLPNIHRGPYGPAGVHNLSAQPMPPKRVYYTTPRNRRGAQRACSAPLPTLHSPRAYGPSFCRPVICAPLPLPRGMSWRAQACAHTPCCSPPAPLDGLRNP